MYHGRKRLEPAPQPLRVVLRVGLLVAAINAFWVALRPNPDGQTLWAALGLFLLTAMIATIGEYVGALSRRLHDRPAYYVREEHTSSVLLREERKNVVSGSDA